MEDDDEVSELEAADGPAPRILPFETWSDLSARMVSLDPFAREKILEETEVDPHDFDASEVHWGKTIGEDITAGDLVRAQAYGAKCVAEIERRKRAARPVDEALAAEATPAPTTTAELRTPPLPKQSLPFAKPVSPDLTLAQWVAIERDLSSRPASLMEVLAAHGIPSLSTFAELQAFWATRLSADPQLSAEHRAMHGRGGRP